MKVILLFAVFGKALRKRTSLQNARAVARGNIQITAGFNGVGPVVGIKERLEIGAVVVTLPRASVASVTFTVLSPNSFFDNLDSESLVRSGRDKIHGDVEVVAVGYGPIVGKGDIVIRSILPTR